MKRIPWALGLVLVAGCVKTERDYQLEYAKELTPKTLAPAPTTVPPSLPPQPARVYLVRAWVDLDYQTQVPHWSERVQLQVTRASEVTKAALNVELKLVAVESWNHRSESGPLQAQLRALEQEDRGTDVDLVLGFVSSLQIFTESQHQLGFAAVPGHHAVLRAMDNAEEHAAITRVFTRLDSGEKEALYRERKVHKEVAVLLHEWAHALGGPHDRNGDSLLNPTYGIARTRFPPKTLELLALSLELRDAKPERKAWATRLRDFIRAAPEGSWVAEDVKESVDDLERVMRGEDSVTLAQASQRDRQLIDEVNRLYEKGQRAEALQAVQPLLDRQPPLVPAHVFACQLAGLVSLTAAETRTRCEYAASLDPNDGGTVLMLAQVHLAARQLPEARKRYEVARGLLLQAPTPQRHTVLAEVARGLQFVTWAEESASKLPGRVAADQVAEWAARKRQWYGLPADVAAPAPAEEPSYVDRFVAAQEALGRNQLGKAEATVAALESDFPALPGPMTLRCELLLRRNQAAKGTAACERALAAWSESLQARYLLGVIASMARQHRKVVQHLEPVVAADASVDDAWERLAVAYGALGDRANQQRAQKKLPAN